MVVIAIDLGTANTRIAVWQNGAAKILKNEGRPFIPSCVAFNAHERFIGIAAKNQMGMNGPNTVYDVKRLTGRKFLDPQVQTDLAKWPFKLSERPNQYPKIDLSIFGEDKSLLPEEVTAMILTRAKEVAEECLKQPVTGAVITVPTMFGSAQRRAVLDAARIAGLTVLRLLNETTAAALAYGMVNTEKKQQIAVIYHLGAGSFDVAIVKITNGRLIRVLGVDGDSSLGGIDIDDCLVQHFADQFDQQNHTNIRNNTRAMQRLRHACEFVKKTLSTDTEAVFEYDFLCEGVEFVSNSTLQLPEFENLCHRLFARTFDTVEDLLEKLKLKKSQIDHVLLIGGSTRSQLITEWHEDFFGASKMNYTMTAQNFEDIVVTGAAVQAGMLTEARFQEMMVHDIVSLPMFVSISPKGRRVPLSIGLNQKVTHRVETTADIETLENYKVFEIKNSTFSKELYVVQKLPPAPEDVKMDCHVFLDKNGVLSLRSVEYVYDLKPNTSTDNNRITTFEMEQAIRNSKKLADLDCENKKKKNKARVEFENSILMLEQNLTSNEKKINELLKNCADEKKWLQKNLHASVDAFEERQRKLNVEFQKLWAKQKLIQSSEEENLPGDSTTKMQEHLDFIAEHRRAEENELQILIRTLREQISHLLPIHGEVTTDKIEQFCDAESAWLSNNNSTSPETLRKRKIDFIGKRDVLLDYLKKQHEQAGSELAATIKAVMKSEGVNRPSSRLEKKLNHQIKLRCTENLEWLQKIKNVASVQELQKRNDALQELIRRKRSTEILMN